MLYTLRKTRRIAIINEVLKINTLGFENKIEQSLGVLIKEKRKSKGLTQAELGELVGISTRHVGKLEDGTYIPKLSTYLKISNVLDFSIEDVKTTQKYTPRRLEADILNVLKGYNESELKLCLDIILSIKKNKSVLGRVKNA